MSSASAARPRPWRSSAVDILVSRVNTLEKVLEDPQVAVNEMVVEMHTAELLEEIGLTPDQIAELTGAGPARTGGPHRPEPYPDAMTSASLDRVRSAMTRLPFRS